VIYSYHPPPLRLSLVVIYLEMYILHTMNNQSNFHLDPCGDQQNENGSLNKLHAYDNIYLDSCISWTDGIFRCELQPTFSHAQPLTLQIRQYYLLLRFASIGQMPSHMNSRHDSLCTRTPLCPQIIGKYLARSTLPRPTSARSCRTFQRPSHRRTWSGVRIAHAADRAHRTHGTHGAVERASLRGDHARRRRTIAAAPRLRQTLERPPLRHARRCRNLDVDNLSSRPSILSGQLNGRRMHC